MINKKIMPIAKPKRSVFGIFGKFVSDLFKMSGLFFAHTGYPAGI